MTTAPTAESFLVEVTDKNFNEIVGKADVAVVAFVTERPATRANRHALELLEKLAEDMSGSVVFAKLATEKNPVACKNNQLLYFVPQISIFKNGKTIKYWVAGECSVLPCDNELRRALIEILPPVPGQPDKDKMLFCGARPPRTDKSL